MKKIISLFFALACLCTACNRPFEMDLPLAVSSNRVELKKEAGSTHVLVYSSKKWTAKFAEEVDWASIDKNEGEGNNEFVFTYSENYGIARKVDVVLETVSEKETITFIQAGAIETPSYSFNPSSVTLTKSSAEIVIPVETNVAYGLETMEVSVDYEQGKDWVSDIRFDQKQLSFKVLTNDSGAARKAVINFLLPEVTGERSDYKNTFSIEQTIDLPSIKIKENPDNYVRNEASYSAEIEENNIALFLDKVQISVTGITEDNQWISDVKLTKETLSFHLSANEGNTQRIGAINLSYTDLDGNTLNVTYPIVQDAVNPYEYLRSLPAGRIPEGAVLTGFIVSDYTSENVSKTTQTGRYMYDFDEPHRTAYIESADGTYGVCLKFESMEAAKIDRWSSARINIGGKNLEIQQNPKCYTVTGLTASDIIETTPGTEAGIPVKNRTIAELTDLDIFTYVQLQGVEILSKDGSYTNVYEGYSYIDESKGINPPDGVKNNPHWDTAPLTMTDQTGRTICMLTNTCAKWRRKSDSSFADKWGSCVPQGSGVFKGIIVAETLHRYNNENVGPLQIRAMAEEDIALNDAKFSKSIAEWTWNTSRSNLAYPDEGNGEIVIYGTAEIASYTDLNNPYWGGNGFGADKAVYIYNKWWDYSGDEGGRYFDVKFSTRDASGSNLIFAITWGHGFFGSTNIGAPALWDLLYSVDGGQTFTKLDGNYIKNSHLFWYTNTTNDSAPGYEEYVRQLPSSCFGKDEVIVRLKVARNVADGVPSGMSDTDFLNNKGREIGQIKNGGYSIRVGSIAVRYN